MIVEGKVPEVLANCTIYCARHGRRCWPARSTAVTSRSASRRVIKELTKDPGAILFIDEIHTVIGAGAASGGVLDASNLIKPVLSSGELRCIGSTTYREYRGVFEKDHALARRFQKIDITEPSIPQTIEILHGLKTRLRGAPQRHLHGRGDRGRGRAVGPAHQRAPAARQGHRRDRRGRAPACGSSRRQPAPNEVDVGQIENVIAKIARIPPKSVSASDRDQLRNLERDLKLVIFGQDKAVDGAGLGHQDGPLRPARAGEAGRRLPVCRAHGRRQDGGHPAARPLPRHRADPLRHVRVHGAAHGLAADRRAAGLRRLRPGRVAHGGDQQASPRRAAARRDREGASGGLQPAAAGHGSRHAHRQQRPQGGFPQRDPRHDHECRRPGDEPGFDRLHGAGQQHRRHGDHQPDVHAGVPQPAGLPSSSSRRSARTRSCASSTSS